MDVPSQAGAQERLSHSAPVAGVLMSPSRHGWGLVERAAAEEVDLVAFLDAYVRVVLAEHGQGGPVRTERSAPRRLSLT